jgi:hypothetical protein
MFYLAYIYAEWKQNAKENEMVCHDLLDDTQMKPQLEESIEQLIWVDQVQAKILLADSYCSINYVVDKHFQKQKAIQEGDNNQVGWV